MERLATYKFNNLNDTGIDKMPVGAQGVVEQAGNLTRFVKGFESTTLTSSTTIGDYLENNENEYHNDILYQSNNVQQGPVNHIDNVSSYTNTGTAGQTDIILDYSINYPLSVYINNVRLLVTDYVASTGDKIILDNSLNSGDSIVIMYHSSNEDNLTGTLVNLTEFTGNSIVPNSGANIRSMNIATDGSKCIIHFSNDDLREYDLSIPWDITTMTLTNAISDSGYSNKYIYVSNDGLNLISARLETDPNSSSDGFIKIYKTVMNTSFDITTLGSKTEILNESIPVKGGIYSSSCITNIISNSTEDIIWVSSFIRQADQGGYVYGIKGFTLSAPGDFESIIRDGDYDISIDSNGWVTDETSSALKGYHFHWNLDGTKLYTRTSPTSDLREFEVTTPWDQSTKAITSILYTVPEYKDWQFLPDNNRVIGVVGNEVKEYKRV